MIIYESDGSCRKAVGDNGFGWWFSGIIIDENLEDFPELDLKMHLRDTKNKNEGSQAKIYQSTVHEYSGTTEIESLPSHKPEHKLIKNKEKVEGFKNINSVVPSKEKLSKLVTPNTYETEILLSVIHFAKYDNLKRVRSSKGAI